MTETCGFSNCGDVEEETFSGGEVDVYGLEVQFSQNYPLSLKVDMPYSFVYTYTQSEFKNSFQSNFAQWGLIAAGDSLPYLADHQATFNIGLTGGEWNANVSVKYVGEMKEVAGAEETLSGSVVPSNMTLDLSASYDFDEYGRVYVKVDNVFDEVEIVSRRPYGARPGKPRLFSVGYKYEF